MVYQNAGWYVLGAVLVFLLIAFTVFAVRRSAKTTRSEPDPTLMGTRFMEPNELLDKKGSTGREKEKSGRVA